MKRLLPVLLCIAAALPVAAQQEPAHLPPNPCLQDIAHDAIVSFLVLGDDQVAAWDVLLADSRAAAEPLRQAIADVQAQIDDQFATGDPDPTTVGDLVIQRRDLGLQLDQVHVDYVDGFEALLDGEQTDKLEFIRHAARARHLVPAFHAFRLLRPTPDDAVQMEMLALP